MTHVYLVSFAFCMFILIYDFGKRKKSLHGLSSCFLFFSLDESASENDTIPPLCKYRGGCCGLYRFSLRIDIFTSKTSPQNCYEWIRTMLIAVDIQSDLCNELSRDYITAGPRPTISSIQMPKRQGIRISFSRESNPSSLQPATTFHPRGS